MRFYKVSGKVDAQEERAWLHGHALLSRLRVDHIVT
jgi:hypothetical protein